MRRHSTREGQKWAPGAYLRSIGVSHLDVLVITNFDEDHASGAPDLLRNNITVGCLLGNPSVPAEVIEYLKTEDGMGPGIRLIATSLGGRKASGYQDIWPAMTGLRANWFWNTYPGFDDENNLSLVLFLEVHGVVFMFPGDMEKAGFQNLLRLRQDFRDWLPRVHVLEASHHGRRNGI